MPNVLSPRDLVFRPDNMDETVRHILKMLSKEAKSRNMASILYSGKMENLSSIVFNTVIQ